MLRPYNSMLSEIDCVLANAVQVKQKQSTAKGCRVLPWLRCVQQLQTCFARGFAWMKRKARLSESLLTRRRFNERIC